MWNHYLIEPPLATNLAKKIFLIFQWLPANATLKSNYMYIGDQSIFINDITLWQSSMAAWQWKILHLFIYIYITWFSHIFTWKPSFIGDVQLQCLIHYQRLVPHKFPGWMFLSYLRPAFARSQPIPHRCLRRYQGAPHLTRFPAFEICMKITVEDFPLPSLITRVIQGVTKKGGKLIGA